jgi:DNA primase
LELPKGVFCFHRMEELFDIIIRTFGHPKKKDFEEGQISVDCPNCDDGFHKGNLEISLGKDIYSCWACRETVDGITGKSISWLLKKYASKDDYKRFLELVPRTKFKEKIVTIEEVILPKEYKPFIKKHEASKEYKTALDYLLNRGLTIKHIQKYKIGFCDSGKFFGRIIVPSFDSFGNINYFIGRDYTGKSKIPYLNHTNPKQDLVFNEGLVNFDLSVTLVEGVFDHTVTFNSIPLLGKTLSPKLVSKLQNDLLGNLYILFDADALKSAKELQERLNFGRLRSRVYIIELPKDQDPSSLYKKLGEAAYYQALVEGIMK